MALLFCARPVLLCKCCALLAAGYFSRFASFTDSLLSLFVDKCNCVKTIYFSCLSGIQGRANSTGSN
jgi:hypothetical protein